MKMVVFKYSNDLLTKEHLTSSCISEFSQLVPAAFDFAAAVAECVLAFAVAAVIVVAAVAVA